MKKITQKIRLITSIFMGLSLPAKSNAQLPYYEPVSGVSGTLKSVGSDSLNNIMALWVENFQAIYTNVTIQFEGKGSSTAPPALTEGIAQLGPMSRQMKVEELDNFETKYGYKPTRVEVALDALAVFVHKDNPIKGLSLQQLDSIFSNTYKKGGSPINRWGAVGLGGSWKNKAISIYGRNSLSGTYGYFKKIALDKGNFTSRVQEKPDSSSVVLSISSNLSGIGYSGVGYLTSGVRGIPIDGAEPIFENCITGDYPLARFLNIYVNKKPGKKLDKLTFEFLRFALSQEGQEVVEIYGYFPMESELAEKVLLGLE